MRAVICIVVVLVWSCAHVHCISVVLMDIMLSALYLLLSLKVQFKSLYLEFVLSEPKLVENSQHFLKILRMTEEAAE